MNEYINIKVSKVLFEATIHPPDPEDRLLTHGRL